jgi:hypothetical protein
MFKLKPFGAPPLFISSLVGLTAVGGATVEVSCPVVDGGSAASADGRVECGPDGTIVLHRSGRPPELALSLKSGNRKYEGAVELNYTETGREICGSRCESASVAVTLH